MTGPGEPNELEGPAVPADGRHPAAFHDGQAHIIRWANPAFLAVFGAGIQGLPGETYGVTTHLRRPGER